MYDSPYRTTSLFAFLVGMLTVMAISFALATPAEASTPEASPEAASEAMAEASEPQFVRLISTDAYMMAVGFTVVGRNLIAEGAMNHNKFLNPAPKRVSITTRAPGRGWSFPKFCGFQRTRLGDAASECAVKVPYARGTVVSLSYEQNGVWSFPLQSTFR